MRRLAGTRVVGFDVVEVSPTLDAAGITAVLARDVIWNFLAFGLPLWR